MSSGESRLSPEGKRAGTRLSEAVSLHRQGRHAEAESLYRKILEASPEDAPALHLLGVLLAQRGDYGAAVEVLARAVAGDPANPGMLYNYGNALRDSGRLEEALASYTCALALQPAVAGTLVNRGAVLYALGRYDEALASYDEALVCAPSDAAAHLNRGNVLAALGRGDDALGCYGRATALRPNHPETFNASGNVLLDLRRFDEAVAAFDRAIALDSGFARAHQGRAEALFELKRWDESFAAYDRAFSADPDLDYLEGSRYLAKAYICDWAGMAKDEARLLGHLREGKRVAKPFVLLATSASPADQLAGARLYAADRFAPRAALWQGERYDHRKIRLAYMSGELREHAVSYVTADLFESHDRDSFELHAIAIGGNDSSPMRRRLESAFDVFLDASNMPAMRIAQAIRDAEIDILVDLNAYFGAGRTEVLALRSAPVQVNFLGFPGTMGAGYMDYILADRTVIPEDARGFYSEKVVYLPDCYQPTDGKRTIGGRLVSRAECGLPEKGLIFCCFNIAHKLTPTMFDIWMRLMGEVEGSVLWLLEASPDTSRNLRREAQARGIAEERLVFAGFVPSQLDHLARLRNADLFLDTLPHNAHTTATDALWSAVPVVTCEGATFPGRVASSLLQAVDLPDLITRSLEDYEALALKLARNPLLLAEVKTRLARNLGTTPLFDTPRFARVVETAYRRMHEHRLRGEAPASFAVEPADV